MKVFKRYQSRKSRVVRKEDKGAFIGFDISNYTMGIQYNYAFNFLREFSPLPEFYF